MPISLPPDLMVSVSGIRGRVGHSLTPELVAGVAASFGSFLGREGRGDLVCVGRDSRTSGPMFEAAVVAGLLSVGCRVVRLGTVPTPTLLLSIGHHGAAGAVGVTASHNPAEWNALKLATGDGMFLDAEAGARFREYLRGSDPPRVAWDELRPVLDDDGAIERHLDAVLHLPILDVSAIRARGFHVALDCVRGAGGAIMPRLLGELGCRVTGMDLEQDGRFPREPEPTAANLDGLGRLVRESGADVGLAVDPDVDRLSLVDEHGVPLGEDLTLALAGAAVLSRKPGVLVTNLSTSQVVEDVVHAHGGRVVRTPVGEINVARRMESESAAIGGEGNGGVILSDLQRTRDAIVATALVLQHLVDEDLTLSGAAGRWPAYVIVKERIAFDTRALAGAYEALGDDLAAEDSDTADGLRLAWPGRSAWLHVRPSGTEPIVRLIAEAKSSDDAQALVDRARTVLEGVA